MCRATREPLAWATAWYVHPVDAALFAAATTLGAVHVRAEHDVDAGGDARTAPRGQFVQTSESPPVPRFSLPWQL